jgi:mRNA-degrading endonuclease toxin of MazEF toxin-antitoxin module
LTRTSSPPPDDRPRPYRVAVAARESGLDRDGWIKADQLATVPAGILRGPIGHLASEAMGRLDAALRFVLDLP